MRTCTQGELNSFATASAAMYICTYFLFFFQLLLLLLWSHFVVVRLLFFFLTVCFLIVIEVTLFFFFNFSVHMYGFCSLFYLQITCFLLLFFFFVASCFLFCHCASFCCDYCLRIHRLGCCFLLFSFFISIFTSKPKQIKSEEKRQTLPLFKSDILLLFLFTSLFFSCFFFYMYILP